MEQICGTLFVKIDCEVVEKKLPARGKAMKEWKGSDDRLQGRRAVRQFIALVMALAVIVFVGGGLYAHMFGILDLSCIQRVLKAPSGAIPPDIMKATSKEQFDTAFREIETGKYDIAYRILDHVEKTAKKDDLREKAQFYKASVAMHYMHDDDLALIDFAAFIEKYPESSLAADAHFFLGETFYQKKRDYVKAIQHLVAFIDRYPNHEKIETANVIVQAAARELARSGKAVGMVSKTYLGGLLPNNAMSLFITFLGLFPAVLMPLAWIMTQYHQPVISNDKSVRQGFREIMRHGILKKLIIIVVLSQILSVALTHYKSATQYSDSEKALQRIGIDIGSEK